MSFDYNNVTNKSPVRKIDPSIVFHDSPPPPPSRSSTPEIVSYKSDFDLDVILGKLLARRIYTKKFDLDPYFELKDLPPVSASRIEYLKNLFEKKLVFILYIKGERIEFTYSLGQLLQFDVKAESHTLLVGGFLKFLLGSKWFLEILSKLDIHLPQSDLLAKVFAAIDVVSNDLDLQRKFITEILSKLDIFDSLIKTLAQDLVKLRKKGEVTEQLKRLIKTNGNIFTRIDFLSLKTERNEKFQDVILRDAILLLFNGPDNLKIELNLATTLEKSVQLSPQDLKLHLSDFLSNPIENSILIPVGEVGKGWKAVFDFICKIYQFHNYDVDAWLRSISYNSLMYRHPGKIPPRVFINLQNHCKINTMWHLRLSNLLKGMAVKHHIDSVKSVTVLAYNALANLLTNGFTLKELEPIYQEMLLDSPAPVGKLGNLYEALKKYPADLVLSLVEIQTILRMSCQKESSKEFFTQHDEKPAILILTDELSLLQNIDPIKALEIISHYSSELDLNPLYKLLEAFGPGQTMYQETSRISEQLPEYFLDPKKINKAAIALIQSRNSSTVLLGLSWLLLLNNPKKLCLQQCRDLIQKAAPGTTLLSFLSSLVSLARDPNLEPILFVENVWRLISELFSPIEKREWEQRIINEIVVHQPVQALNRLLTLQKKELVSSKQVQDILGGILSHSFISKEIQLITLLIKNARQLIDNEPSFSQGISSMVQKKILEFIENNEAAAAANLVLSATTEDIIDKNTVEVAYLWLMSCEAAYNKISYKAALKIWKKADECNIWSKRLDYHPHLEFLLSFIGELYTENSLEENNVGHSIFEKLPEPRFKGDLAHKYNSLKLIRDQKIHDLRQNQATLSNSIKTFETNIKQPLNQTQAEQLRLFAIDLLSKLLIQNPVNEINAANFLHSRSLLSNPKVQQLLQNDLKSFLKVVLSFLQNLEKYKDDKTRRPLINMLLELYFKNFFGNPEFKCDAIFIEILTSSLKNREIILSESLQNEILTKLTPLFSHFKTSCLPYEACLLLEWVSQLKKEDEGSNTDKMEMTLWAASELISKYPLETSKTTLAINCLTKMQKKVVFQSDFLPSLQVECYMRIAQIIEKKSFSQALPWIESILKILICTKLTLNKELSLQFIKWSKSLAAENQFTILSKVFAMIQREHPNLIAKLFKAVEALPDLLLQEKPSAIARIFLEQPSKLLTRRVNLLINALLKKSYQIKRTDLCLKFFERNICSLNLHFANLVGHLTTMGNTALITRGLNVQMQRIKNMQNCKLNLLSKDICLDFLKSLEGSIALNTHNFAIHKNKEEYQNFSNKVLELLGEENSAIDQMLVSNHSPQISTLPGKILETLLLDVLKFMKNPGNHLELAVNMITAQKNKAHWLESNPTRLRTNMLLFDLTSHTNVPDLFYRSGLILYEEFKRKEKEDFEELVNHFVDYLGRAEEFTPETSIYSFALMEAIVKDHILPGFFSNEQRDKLFDAVMPHVHNLPSAINILPVERLKDEFISYKILHLVIKGFEYLPYAIGLFVGVCAIRRRDLSVGDFFIFLMLLFYWDRTYRRNLKAKIAPMSTQKLSINSSRI